MKARVTVCVRADGSFEMLLNEAGRDLMVEELERLDRNWDHFHLDHISDPALLHTTEVPLSTVPYQEGDRCFEQGKILFWPDDWDVEYYPHVMAIDGQVSQ